MFLQESIGVSCSVSDSNTVVVRSIDIGRCFQKIKAVDEVREIVHKCYVLGAFIVHCLISTVNALNYYNLRE